jgi:hypothetical protein
VTRSTRLREGLALGLVLAACAWLHAGALSAPFFADDYLFLDQVRGRSIVAALAAPDPIGNFLRPVGRALWFWTVSRVGGESPVPFHAANLALLLGAVALLHAIARRLAGAFAGLIAASWLALHHAGDVAVRWASGSQDLLALAGALGALALHRAGRRAWAAACLALALLSKETVALAPLVAVPLARRPGEPWRSSLARAWPLAAVTATWAVVWLATAAARPAAGATLSFGPAHLPAALAHLAQMALAVEWAPGRLAAALAWPAAAPLAAVLAALALVAAARPAAAPARPRAAESRAGAGRRDRGAADRSAAAARATRPARRAAERAGATAHGAPAPRPGLGASAPRPALAAGLAWALLGALPVAVAVASWSAYYYLFALCGMALAIGTALARAPRAVAFAALALLAATSGAARRLDEFATRPDPWATLSHVNRRYVERAELLSMRLLADLRAARPALPHGATLFFRALPAWSAFQVGDGALVRWAYRDTSLRSYLQTQYTAARARRGTALFFSAQSGRLVETPLDDSALPAMAITQLIDGHLDGARDLLALAVERQPGELFPAYALAWIEWSLERRPERLAPLGALGFGLDAAPPPEIRAALARVERGDTTGALADVQAGVRRAVLHPGAHALLADLTLAAAPQTALGALEAWIALQLAPEDPWMWRRWAMVQYVGDRYPGAQTALERYFALGGSEAASDTLALEVRAALRQRVLGGDLVRAGLRVDPLR